MKTIFKVLGLIIGLSLLLSFLVPVSFPEKYVYKFNVTYVNGDKRTILLNLPENFTYGVYSHKGSYYIRTFSYGYTIWGYKSPFDFIEKDIVGALYINYVTKK